MPAEKEAVRGGGVGRDKNERVDKLAVRVEPGVLSRAFQSLLDCCTSWLVARGSGVFVVEVIVEASSSTYGLFVVRAFCVGETAFWVVRKFVVRACFIIEFVVGRGSLVVVVRAPCVGETACVWSRRGVRRPL